MYDLDLENVRNQPEGLRLVASMYQLPGARLRTSLIATFVPRTRFSKPSFWIAIEASISWRVAVTVAMHVVSGPLMCNCLSSLRSWIIKRVPRVRYRFSIEKKLMNVVPAE